ncbi:MAG: TMEM165/GDT1 family protein [Phycisphaerae bacterium]|jgi:putative Ca2+/H+ antiporter (TMEM165/GDT1 family)|nr:TMEM165/GDT1 family protein [Phycisphaerae bacterium]
MFGLIFVAELGDKTQVAMLLAAAKHGNPWMVFLGSAAALVVASGLAVMVGYLGNVYLPRKLLTYVAGAGFIVMGIWMLASTRYSSGQGL